MMRILSLNSQRRLDIVDWKIAFFMNVISFISAELVELKLPDVVFSRVPEDPGERQYISIDQAGECFLYLLKYTDVVAVFAVRSQ